MSKVINMEGTNLVYGKSTHFLLKYAKVKGSYINAQQAMELAPGKWSAPYRVKEAFERLEKYGFLERKDDSWKITPQGVLFLQRVARKKEYVRKDKEEI